MEECEKTIEKAITTFHNILRDFIPIKTINYNGYPPWFYDHINPLFSYCSISIPTENVRKRRFQEV